MITLFDRDGHRNLLVHDLTEGSMVQANQHLIVAGSEAMILDPGGHKIYTKLFAQLASVLPPKGLRHVFLSHQDPDIISSLALWLVFNPELKCHLSWLWSEFVPHFGGNRETFIAIPDEGTRIQLGKRQLQAVPAHYLHSSGNFHLYDADARILFSGDVGGAMLPPEQDAAFVTDFDRHIRHAKGFHQRWMGSKDAVLDWCERAAALSIDLLCPQHGAVYQGADVTRFINWFAELDVGSGIKD